MILLSAYVEKKFININVQQNVILLFALKDLRLMEIHYLNFLFIAPKFSLGFIKLLNHVAQKMPCFIFSYISWSYLFFGERV